MKYLIICLLLLSACYPTQFAWEDVCIERGPKEIPCLNKIQYYVPYNTTSIDMILTGEELCYDFTKDESEYREYVKNLYNDYGSDAMDYINWTPDKSDPEIEVFRTNESQVKIVKVFNGTVVREVCLKSEIRLIAI